jgi:hypothetical protein
MFGTPAAPAVDLADEVWDLWRERLVEIHPKANSHD